MPAANRFNPQLVIAYTEHDITQAMECLTTDEATEYLEDALRRLAVLRRILPLHTQQEEKASA